MDTVEVEPSGQPYENNEVPAHADSDPPSTSPYEDDENVDVGALLRQLARLIIGRRINPSVTYLGRVTLHYFDEEAAAEGEEPFRLIVLPRLRLPVDTEARSEPEPLEESSDEDDSETDFS